MRRYRSWSQRIECQWRRNSHARTSVHRPAYAGDDLAIGTGRVWLGGHRGEAAAGRFAGSASGVHSDACRESGTGEAMSVNPAWRNQHTDLTTGHVHKCLDCPRMLTQFNAKRCNPCAAKIKMERDQASAIRRNNRINARRLNDDIAFIANAFCLSPVSDREMIVSVLPSIRRRFSKATP